MSYIFIQHFQRRTCVIWRRPTISKNFHTFIHRSCNFTNNQMFVDNSTFSNWSYSSMEEHMNRETCTFLLMSFNIPLMFSINSIALRKRDWDDERWMFCDASSIWKGTRPEKSDLANWVTAFKGKSWNRFKKQSSARAILDGEHPSLEVNRIQHENWKLNQSRFSLLVVNGFICIY